MAYNFCGSLISSKLYKKSFRSAIIPNASVHFKNICRRTNCSMSTSLMCKHSGTLSLRIYLHVYVIYEDNNNKYLYTLLPLFSAVKVVLVLLFCCACHKTLMSTGVCRKSIFLVTYLWKLFSAQCAARFFTPTTLC